ncbi:MAG: DNA recombination protein RmuC [Micrococcales bacterium]|nr:DNA recombination protein RmuC [Micrococcales bacterium]
MDLLSLLFGLLLGSVLGAVGAWLLRRPKVSTPAFDPAALGLEHERAVTALREDTARIRAELERDIARLEATESGLRDQLATAAEQQRAFAERVDAERRDRQEQDKEENRVVALLTPVQESLRAMQSKVTELETQRSREHGELTQQLRSATESEERLRATAESLASALRNNSTRGVWGETQLRAVVEAAGMMEHVNFEVQTSVRIESRSARPDMVVHLPGSKSIAVDAKVPFTAYLEATAIPATAEPTALARRDALLKAHVKAVRDHIVALGSRSYWDGLDSSPEMVVAFIPSESLLSSALEADPSVMEFAFSKHVALASPVTLFSVLKAVAVSWRHEVVTQEAKVLFEVSRELYGRITKLAEHVDKLGRSLERSVKDYNTFVGSLERQVLPSARRIAQLDESKVLPQLREIEEDTRQVSASDLTAVLEEQRTALAGTERPQLDLRLPAEAKLEATA